MGAVTYIDEKRDYRTFKFSLIEKYGCTKEVFTRLKYAKTIVERIMQSKSTYMYAKKAGTNSKHQKHKSDLFQQTDLPFGSFTSFRSTQNVNTE